MTATQEDPVAEIRLIKADLAKQDGHDLTRMTQSLLKLEAELRAKGQKFADAPQTSSRPTIKP